MAGEKGGLEGVVAGRSAISYVYGEEGRLIYHGYDIHDLAENSTFEEVAFLLWHGRLPTRTELNHLDEELRRHRALPGAVQEAILRYPREAHPMDALRSAISLLGMYDPEAGEESREANLRRAVRLTAQAATCVAAIHRARSNEPLVPPDPELNHASNFLYMLQGRRPSATFAKVFDVALVLHADHEFNASTFAARVTVATESDMYSGITSAIGALKGPLHGGANERVMRALLEIGEVDRTESWVRAKLERKEKIPGFGHRVYRTEDPRATHLRKFSRALGEDAGNLRWYEMSRIMEKLMVEEKGIYPNVDFYSASTYYTMGIPVDLFTPVFAVSRIAGWTAHILEQQADNRLIRPRSEYVGRTKAEYVPIDQRG